MKTELSPTSGISGDKLSGTTQRGRNICYDMLEICPGCHRDDDIQINRNFGSHVPESSAL